MKTDSIRTNRLATGATLLVGGLLLGCVPPPQTAGPSPDHGFETFATGVGNLVVSPLMMAAGLLEGIATLPYFVAADLHAMNRTMIESSANVDMDRTYQYAYRRSLDEVPASGDTGKAFRFMSEATAHFRNVLAGYGVEDPERYVLTAVRTADREGYTLYAVLYRPVATIRVRDDRSPGSVRVLTARDREFYRPYERDADGRPLDTVIDWAGVPRTAIKTQKGQAILMTLAANSVLFNRRSDEYWIAQRRWTAGQYLAIVEERKRYLDRRLGLAG